ncbi:hypothetical protein N825_22850 [Skermanella stibiiresistens SB22]|uniref:Uncharacterized protein n=1 Tax=Skermanella stibiiresistens SB22 TaxID=1385369 RepID=W9GT50_9PROT|nr:hypothetical protein [Skermanella stibiiresistens]EWY36954.1 hypothetical protein N825_22850 [Skermanella stibiiresistens SB22]
MSADERITEPRNTQSFGPTGKASEYLEKLIADSFKREMDQEENVIRSLPFFATSIGVLVTFVGFARGLLPAFSRTSWPELGYGILVHGALAGLLVSLLALLLFLYKAVRERQFEYPMSESEMLDYAASLTAYYRALADEATASGGGDDDPVEVIERAVVDDLRATMMGQMAASAKLSRANNLARLKARARAFSALMTALGFALVLIVAILIHDALNGGSHGQDGVARPGIAESQRAGPEDGTPSGEAKGAGHAGSREGTLELRGSPAEKRDTGRGEQEPVNGRPTPLPNERVPAAGATSEPKFEHR